MFHPAVLDHFEHPRNAGELESPSAAVEVTNPVCGDVLHLAVRVHDGRVSEVKFKTRGCVTSIAASSALTELILGKWRAEISVITPEEISAALGGLPPATFHGAQLAADAAAALLPKLPR